ncbi:Phenylalanine ammonia-lyase [Hordeum vulgare]|nr:Phenylalanine ammonia-lyase [Hordeum vulgare]
MSRASSPWSVQAISKALQDGAPKKEATMSTPSSDPTGSKVSVSACPVLATPTCAFVPGVFLDLANLERRIVNIDFVRLRMRGAGNTDACLRPLCVPGLGKLGVTSLNYVFFLTHHYFDTTAPMTNSAPPCPRGSTTTSSTLATPTQHRPQHSSHGYFDHGYTILRSRVPRSGHSWALDGHTAKGTERGAYE